MSKATLLVALAAAFVAGAGSRHILPQFLRPAVAMPARTPDPILHDEATSFQTEFRRDHAAVPCPVSATVILIVGQSNAANYGGVRHRAGPRITYFYDGRCYAAIDPLLGSSGDRGSIWPVVADRLAKDGRQIILVPLAIGNTRMVEWAPAGRLHARIELAVAQLAVVGVHADISLVVQGEAEGEGHGDPIAYRRDATALLRSLPGKVWFATTTRCWDAVNPAIRRAQALARAASGAAAGPDLDAVPNAMRINGCHYGGAGMQRLADEWVAVLNKALPALSRTSPAAVMPITAPTKA